MPNKRVVCFALPNYYITKSGGCQRGKAVYLLQKRARQEICRGLAAKTELQEKSAKQNNTKKDGSAVLFCGKLFRFSLFNF